MDDANFAKGPSHFFDQLPEAIRDGVRRETRERVKANLHAHGMGRHTPAEIARLGARSLKSLAQAIGDKPYLMGDKPTGADATAFAFAVSALTPFFSGPLHDAAVKLPVLTAYSERILQRYYPEMVQVAA